jgi:hypothetical protein
MFEPTIVTWIIVVFGFATCLPLLYAQLVFLLQPKGEKAKNILIGKNEEWRDKTHFKSAYGMAWADWLFFLPVFIVAVIGIVSVKPWGYTLLSVAGAIQLYINTVLWFLEKEYVYPNCGPLAYYTYYWGNFMYWGTLSMVYGVLRVNGVSF